MQPTPRSAAWSAWAGWAGGGGGGVGSGGGGGGGGLLERRRVRLTVHQLELPRREWARAHQPLYTPDQLRHLLRLESALGWWSPTPPDRWRLERRPQLEPHWRLPDFMQNVRLERPPLEGGSAGGRAGGGRGGGGWEGAAQGWAGGAVLLAALLLLVRALERCLHRRLFKGRRRPSEEWPTPSVLATSHQYGHDLGAIPHLDDSDAFQSDNRDSATNDLPPPYSACAPSSSPGKPPSSVEEPPPPYSACYFSNPKDGVPTVHFYNRTGGATTSIQVGNSSTDSDDAPNTSVVTSRTNEEIADDTGCESIRNMEDTIYQREVTSDDNVSDVSVTSSCVTADVVVIRRDGEIRVELLESESSRDSVLRV